MQRFIDSIGYCCLCDCRTVYLLYHTFFPWLFFISKSIILGTYDFLNIRHFVQAEAGGRLGCLARVRRRHPRPRTPTQEPRQRLPGLQPALQPLRQEPGDPRTSHRDYLRTTLVHVDVAALLEYIFAINFFIIVI